ncbi:hypothetical protein [Clostridium fallax]|uniref:Tetratricopeptide repeat-containing protein n=1 Tax=Clostridium fallax TaxID=1533 RepID=A0A1M4YF33_9CLOT|nr:hypothetical protein [Clostridium fallax]SHF04223.1 hypothetical protein SAMN05443638_12714 [Clostridium fallax]SQB22316.1 XRE family transcriptional regulator [Clostridium fallax]
MTKSAEIIDILTEALKYENLLKNGSNLFNSIFKLINKKKIPSFIIDRITEIINDYSNKYPLNLENYIIYENCALLLSLCEKYQESLKLFLSICKLPLDMYYKNKIYCNSVKCHMRLGNYKKAINLCNFCIKNIHYLDQDTAFNCHFNLALCYKNIMDYDKSLEEIQNIEYFFNMSKFNIFDTLLLKANLLAEKNYTDSAMAIYNLIFNSSSKSSHKLIITCHIMEIYINSNDVYLLKKSLRNIKNYIKSDDNFCSRRYYQFVYYSMLKGYCFIEDYNKSSECIINILNNAIKATNYKYIDKVFQEMVKFYSKIPSKDYLKIKNLFNKIMSSDNFYNKKTIKEFLY